MVEDAEVFEGCVVSECAVVMGRSGVKAKVENEVTVVVGVVLARTPRRRGCLCSGWTCGWVLNCRGGDWRLRVVGEEGMICNHLDGPRDICSNHQWLSMMRVLHLLRGHDGVCSH